MKVCLMTFNAKYIHKALSLRWLYVARDENVDAEIVEYTLKDDLAYCTQDMVQRKPDVIGCSVYIWNAEMMRKWIVLIKQALPHVRIIIGGPEVSYEPWLWLDLPIECVLRGEGEKTFWQAVRKEEEIDGYYSKDKISPVGYARSDIAWLETLESPYFLAIDEKEMQHRYFYFETSRGCPYQCSYCLSSLDQRVRFFSDEYVFKQLKRLESVKVKQVKLLDRTFNASDAISLTFLRKLEQMMIDASFQFEVVADKLSDTMLAFLMNEATVSKYRFEIGIQSFHLPTLEAVGRKQNLEKCKEVIKLLTDIGYVLHTDLIGGLPYEDLDTFEKSYNELFSTGAKEIQVGLLKLLKGTRLKKEAEEYEIVYDKKAPYTVVKTKWLSEADVECIECVYHATEKLYNSQRCFHAIQKLYQLRMIESPFQVFLEAGKKMQAYKNIQVRDYFILLYEAILNANPKADEKVVQALLQNDYVLQFKQRSKKLFDWRVDEAIQKEIREKCVSSQLLDEQQVYNYTDFYWGYCHEQIAVMMVLYSNRQEVPKRIYFDDKGVLKDERNLDSNNQ